MEQSISLGRAVTIIRKHLLVIVIWGALLGVAAWALATFVMTPKYQAQTQLLVSRKADNNNTGVQYSDQQADVQMITTYKELITNQVILNKVSDELAHPAPVVTKEATATKYGRDLDGKRIVLKAGQPAQTKPSSEKTYSASATQLQKMISISNQQNSQVFAINVKTTDPHEAARIANLTAEVFKAHIKKIMAVNNVTIVSKATTNSHKVSPRTGYLTVLGVICGLLVGLIYAFIRELTDRTVKDDALLTETLGLTNLGHVSKISNVGQLASARAFRSRNDGEAGGKSAEPKHLSSRV
ncbi:YveK family protein [Furfurilactobacillus entadae]|uniref:YveK family protein n=1 Tax=Furfurilactobacillus entadae TaxID=2922307 RepID=UPI0035EF3DCE